jgi:AraC-like DNA-binding protein
MVCNRCIMVVENIFNDAGLRPESVELGRVTLKKSPTAAQLKKIEENLEAVGFEILTDQKKKLVERIKSEITKTIQGDLSEQKFNFSQILSSTLNKEYSALSKLFSEAEGITIERFIIDQKIERAKEMLAYGEKNLNDIAFELGYSSLAHFSAQFKKITGFTPSEFKKLKDHHRRPLDEIGNP